MTHVGLHYGRHASQLGERYRSVSFDDVHAALLRFLPPSGASILDVGAGAGRDAYALASMGYLVTAVEPSEAMRSSVVPTPGSRVTWVDDALPSLLRVKSKDRRYDFILCSAVLMHLAPNDLQASFAAMSAMAAEGGKVAITLRKPTPDDPPGVFFDHSVKALIVAATRNQLSLVETGRNADVFGRTGVDWSWAVFQK